MIAAAAAVASLSLLSGCSFFGSDGSSTSAGEAPATAASPGTQGQVRGEPTVVGRLARSADAPEYYFVAGTKAAGQRFSAATRPIKGLYTGAKVRTAVAAGAPVADVAIYTFPAAKTTDVRFQGQLISQLVGQAGGTSKVTFKHLGKRSAAVARTSSSAVGYFDGNQAVVVLARKSAAAQSLTAATDVAYAYAAS